MAFLNLRVVKRKKAITGFEGSLLRIYILIAGLAFVGILFFLNGFNPFQIYFEIISVAYFKSSGRTETIINFIPLMIIGIAIAIPAKAKIDNIGAEGQFIIGAMGGYWVALTFPDLHPIILIPLMFIVGAIGGALWAIPIALFRVKGGFKGADVVVSFLLVFPAELLLLYMINGSWRSGRFLQSAPISDNAVIGKINGEIPYTLILAIAILIIMNYFFFKSINGTPKTKITYEINVIGENETAAKVSGINFMKVALVTTIISGGLSGMAGTSQLAGQHLILRESIGSGFGFTAIAVAWLGRLSPIGIVFSAILFAGLIASSPTLQLKFGLPKTTVDLLNGTILIFVLISEFFLKYTITRRSKKQ